jgi:predicted acylesterase/phospholipase RssA
MQASNSSNVPEEYWYRKDGAVEHWFYGVFEGGGAKGVAFSGALLAMKQQQCWFRGVAGASAGAITAALVACGLPPEELDQATADALNTLKTGGWKGLKRLCYETGYFPADPLRDWLEGLLQKQLARKLGRATQDKITFQQLYDATHIELNVVATDLSLKHQIIFSHWETPNCGVADAVVASSSIPFALPSSLLRVPGVEPGDRPCHHTIVDGGVWSNFPLFVFEDHYFREDYGRRDPKQLEPRDILGFLLDEQAETQSVRGESIRFTGLRDKSSESDSAARVKYETFRAREWIDKPATPQEPSTLGARILAIMLFPFGLLGQVLEWCGGVEPGRWPRPRSKLTRYVLHGVSGLLGGINPPLMGVLACLVVGIGAYHLVGRLGLEMTNTWRSTHWTDPMWDGFRLFAMGLISLGFMAVAILMVPVTVLGVLSNYVLLRASRRLLFGLAMTYVASPGAPAWVAKRPNVIALPIPPNVTTLRFNMKPEERRDLIESARNFTKNRLEDILSRRRRDSGIIASPQPEPILSRGSE